MIEYFLQQVDMAEIQDSTPDRQRSAQKLEEQLYEKSFKERMGGGVWGGAVFGLGYGAIVGGVIAAVAMLASTGAVSFSNIFGAMGLFGGLSALSGKMMSGDKITAVRTV